VNRSQFSLPLMSPSTGPNVVKTLAVGGYGQSMPSGPLSEALMCIESQSFLNDMFTPEYAASIEATFFVFNRTQNEGHLVRWSAVAIHSTNQFFIKAPSMSNISRSALIDILDFAEQLGYCEAFVCVPRYSMDCDDVVEEVLKLDFSLVSPRGRLGEKFVLLRFEF